ncbi:carbohydrate ABC transporter permease [Paenibacillus doosanensis]|uniref:L-arabinose transport system permease protein AraQ n=1 Tax=Paenibacillus konkukensis TaxID=2020716 RepID=A0ABY4RTZ9_9BACL|nr:MULTISPECIES: carbohydrate ABC transporter permease [Paenibacillus]MCS7464240.1 carbohydrate ABC transporter permease [Paenibacillus doosanensis]UQZ85568.1 L-arabinose transport system permease protein AraQ [Paenibacillus konkukensis]
MADKSIAGRLLDGINYLLLILIAAVCVVPFIYILAASITEPAELIKKGFILFPTKLSLVGYRYILSTDVILSSLGVSVFITVAGTMANLFFTALMAYPLAQKDLMGVSLIMKLVVFSMLFSGGMIPTYLVVKETGLLDNPAALIVPGLISAFNLIIMRSFFQQLPDGLEEAARIDGCSDIAILFRIVLPLSAPVLASLALFYAVGHWNSYFNAILYINDNAYWPIQVWLRQIVILAQGGIGDSAQFGEDFIPPPAETVKMAVIVLSTLPILVVYPFLQKHFAKGALLGSVKG